MTEPLARSLMAKLLSLMLLSTVHAFTVPARHPVHAKVSRQAVQPHMDGLQDLAPLLVIPAMAVALPLAANVAANTFKKSADTAKEGPDNASMFKQMFDAGAAAQKEGVSFAEAETQFDTFKASQQRTVSDAEKAFTFGAPPQPRAQTHAEAAQSLVRELKLATAPKPKEPVRAAPAAKDPATKAPVAKVPVAAPSVQAPAAPMAKQPARAPVAKSTPVAKAPKAQKEKPKAVPATKAVHATQVPKPTSKAAGAKRARAEQAAAEREAVLKAEAKAEAEKAALEAAMAQMAAVESAAAEEAAKRAAKERAAAEALAREVQRAEEAAARAAAEVAAAEAEAKAEVRAAALARERAAQRKQAAAAAEKRVQTDLEKKAMRKTRRSEKKKDDQVQAAVALATAGIHITPQKVAEMTFVQMHSACEGRLAATRAPPMRPVCAPPVLAMFDSSVCVCLWLRVGSAGLAIARQGGKAQEPPLASRAGDP